MWAPAFLPLVMIGLAAGVIALMLANPDGRFQMLAVTVVVGVIAIAGFIHQNVQKKGAE